MTYRLLTTNLAVALSAVSFGSRVVASRRFHNTALRRSYAKQLFCGRLVKEKIFPFPGTVTEEEKEKVAELLKPYEKQFGEKANSESASLSTDVWTSLRELSRSGLLMRKKYGGNDLSESAFVQLTQSTSQNFGLLLSILAYQSSAFKVLLQFGSREQVDRYLPYLENGNCLSALCLAEPDSHGDLASIQCRATLSDDKMTFFLTGEKLWISNSGNASVFIVFAKTKVRNEKDEPVDTVAAFLVEKAFDGVADGKTEDKFGVRWSTVQFDKTPVPVDNLFGYLRDGAHIAKEVRTCNQFGFAAASTGAMKIVLDNAAQCLEAIRQSKQEIVDFTLLQEHLGRLAVKVYAAESMVYLTGGLMDRGEPDCSLEAAMCKIFGAESAMWSVNEFAQVFEGLNVMKDFPFEQYLRDGQASLSVESPNDVLQIFVAIQGIEVIRDRNKKFFEAFKRPTITSLRTAVSTILKYRKEKKENTRVFQTLDVPKELKEYAKLLVEHTARFASLSRFALLPKRKSGQGRLHLTQKHIADIAINLFAMSAVISRASYAMKMSAHEAAHEVRLCEAFCISAANENMDNFFMLQRGPRKLKDFPFESISDEVCESQSYRPSQPFGQ